jgi:hypothetical protein
MGSNKIDWSIVKRNEELRILENMKMERDPSRIYNSKVEFIDKSSTTLPKAGLMLVPNINYNRKLPQLVENATITIIKDDELLYKAGGYHFGKIYLDLAKYAKLGLYDE